MVRVEKKKLIIEIETNDPRGDLSTLQTSLINVMKNYKPQEGDDKDCTTFFLGDLLQELLPTFEQTSELYPEAKN